MGPKRRRTADVENKQPPKQHRSSVVTRSQSSLSDHDNSNLPVVVFAHGAGASSSSEWMIRLHCFNSFIFLSVHVHVFSSQLEICDFIGF